RSAGSSRVMPGSSAARGARASPASGDAAARRHRWSGDVAALDPRLLRRARSARTAIAASVTLGVLTALLVVAQACLLALVIARTVAGAEVGRGAWAALLAVVVLRAVAAYASETVAARCAVRVKAELRLALLGRAAQLDGAPGALATLATRGI